MSKTVGVVREREREREREGYSLGEKRISLFDSLTHTGSASGYLAYKKISKENIKTHGLYMYYGYS